MDALGEKATPGTPPEAGANEYKAKNPGWLFWLALLIAAIVVVALMFS
jgi:hypothetical protein